MISSSELFKLQQAVRESRITISREYAGLLSDLDIQKRVTESFRHHPLRWIGGTLVAGMLATLLGRSKKKPSKKSEAAPLLLASAKGASLSKIGWLAATLEVGKLLYPILRPAIVEFISHASQSALAKRGRPQ